MIVKPADAIGEVAGYSVNWLLFSQNQFAIAGDTQTVFITVMVNDNFILGIEQLFATEFSFVAHRIGSNNPCN